MRLVIITQNDPFYLSQNLNYLINNLRNDYEIVGVVISDVSPFGKKESFIKKAFKTKKIFGLKFFIYYSLKFIYSKIFKTSVRTLLKKFQIPEIIIEGPINSIKNIELIGSYNPDLLISILGNQIFKKPLLDLAPKGCINLHTAMLPKYRGLMPTFWVLKNNQKNTGVSVFFVDEGIDSGPIIIQEKVKIGNQTQAQLIMQTKKIGMELIVKAVNLISENNLVLIPNPDSEKSYYSFPSRQDVIEFEKIGKRFF